jgi:FkbM family methyltransferase
MIARASGVAMPCTRNGVSYYDRRPQLAHQGFDLYPRTLRNRTEYMIGNRSLRQLLSAVFKRQHYVALINMQRLYPKFLENLWRYLTGAGEYPYDIAVRTPVGLKSMRLYSHHDLLTVNEIFCRQDYFADRSLKYVIDLGSNIGISAIYFLTRNGDATCALYEPNPHNIERLRLNLQGYESRYSLNQLAVSNESGEIQFGIEPTGRYGGIAQGHLQTIVVSCVHINDVIEGALRDHSNIDILKVDTEGVEIQTIEAIDGNLLDHISKIYLESDPMRDLHPDRFTNEQYGSVRRLQHL